jgi:hypothetical protein
MPRPCSRGCASCATRGERVRLATHPASLRALIACGAFAFLSSCGGGNGAATGNGETPPPQGTGSITPGAYYSESVDGNLAELLIVHGDGRMVGNAFSSDPASMKGASVAFAGPTTPAAGGAVSPQATLFVSERQWDSNNSETSYSTAVGTARVLIAQPTPSTLKADLTEATIPTPLSTFSYAPISIAARGVPLQQLAGRYGDGSAPNSFGTDVVLDPLTGSLTGTYVTGCQIDGRLYGYDSANAVFRLDATFKGAGCTGQYIAPAGAGEFVGYVFRAVDGRLVLTSAAILGGKFLLLNFFLR